MAEQRVPVTLRLPAEVVESLNAEAERRVVGRNLLILRAIELLREADRVAPDLVDLPPPPRSR